jgi:hypothetical protein
MEERRQRIAALSRMNRGSALQPRFLVELSAALSTPISPTQLLDLAQTDSVRNLLSQGYRTVLENRQPSFRKFFSRDQVPHLLYLIDCLALRLGSEEVILHLKNSGLCGAIFSEAQIVLSRPREVINLDGDSLNILSLDKQQGIILDFNPDEFEEHYELSIWGDRWSFAII